MYHRLQSEGHLKGLYVFSFKKFMDICLENIDNNLNKSLDSKVAKEMAKKIAEDAKMHRKAREI